MAPRKTAKKATRKTTRAASTEGGTCLVTGEATSNKRSRFLPGHDAKLKSVLLKVMRGEAKPSEIPSGARKVLQGGETLVGFRMTDSGTVKQVDGNSAAPAKRTRKEPATATKRRRRKSDTAAAEVAA